MINIDEIYSQSPYEKDYINKTNLKDVNESYSDVYGEVTKNGVENMLIEFKDFFNKDTVFYDLGCGLGKMVLHIGLKHNIKKSCGIELSNERFKGALELKEKYAKEKNNIEFLKEDYFKCDLSDANVVYFDNTAMYDIIHIQSIIIPRKCKM